MRGDVSQLLLLAKAEAKSLTYLSSWNKGCMASEVASLDRGSKVVYGVHVTPAHVLLRSE